MAVSAGADAIGLVLASSPRQISLEQAKQLAQYVAEHHPGVLTFAVTADRTPEELCTLVQVLAVSGVQPHGRYSQEAGISARLANPELAVLEPVGVDPVKGLGDWSTIPEGHRPLFDTKMHGVEGGSGISFDWGLVADVSRQFVLAGGLNAENVAQAVAISGAWGVDASSGLESSPGTKDLIRIRDFVQGAKS